MDIKSIFEKCFSEIGGKNNKDIRWYFKRPKRVTRDSFFEQAVWAIWVSGLRRTSAESFLKSAEKRGFTYDHRTMACLTKADLRKFMENLHGRPIPSRARKKWEAIYQIAKWLSAFPKEKEFREAIFGGKIQTASLDETDVNNLLRIHLPFIGEANAQFIIRNMGGETIKCDRWIKAFLNYSGFSIEELKKRLKRVNIPLGLFDVVLWAYCESQVKKTKEFPKHFRYMTRTQS